MDWAQRARQAAERYRDGEGRVDAIEDADQRQRQLTRLGNAAWAAGLSLLMEGQDEQAREWLRRAAARYRESWDAGAPPDAWGRPIAATKALLLAGEDAAEAARWALAAGADAASPVGRYAAALALLVLGRDEDAAVQAEALRGRDDFPGAVAASLAALAAGDGAAYAAAVGDVLRSFEQRDEFLEDVPVADTCLVLERLAAARGLAAGLRPSPRLPAIG